jgi:hypothetical protein
MATDPTIMAFTHPLRADGPPTPSAPVRPSLRAAREKAEERRRLALGDHILPIMSEEMGFDVSVKFRRMTLQEVVTSGNVPDELREYADVLFGAMTSAAMSGRNGKKAEDATESGVGTKALAQVQEEFGAVEFIERQKLSMHYTVMAACIDPMIVPSDDPDVYTDPDNMLILSDIPDQDLSGLYMAITRNEKEAVLTDLKSLSAEDAEPDQPEDAEGGAADGAEDVPVPEAIRVPAYPSGD